MREPRRVAQGEHVGHAHYLLGVQLEKDGTYEIAQYHYEAALAKKVSGKLEKKGELCHVEKLEAAGFG